MERMTHERANGIKTGYWSPETKETLVQRLAAYENTGLEPWEIGPAIEADSIGLVDIKGRITKEETK